MLEAPASASADSSFARPVRPLPGRLSQAKAESVIVITDSESDDDISIIESPKKRRRIQVDNEVLLDTFVDNFEELVPTGAHFGIKALKTGQADAASTSLASASPTRNEDANGSAEIGSLQLDVEQQALESIASDSTGKVDPIDGFLAQILEIVPDVEPDHARALLTREFDMHGYGALEFTLHALFETPYPKLDRKGKGKRKREAEDDTGRNEIDSSEVNYGKKDRPFSGGRHYKVLALVSSASLLFRSID